MSRPSAHTLRFSGEQSAQGLWDEPEQFLLDAGTAGELVIARVRIAITLVLLLIPVTNILFADAGEWAQHLSGLAVNGTACALSFGVYWLVTRDQRKRWLPMATSLFDVTLVTLAQITFAFVSDPQVVVNSKITFDTYFIALAGTCLRYDKRVALVAGLVAMLQFAGTVIWVATSFPLDLVGGVSIYGRFQWSDQLSRLILLATATTLNVYIVNGIQQQRRLSNSDALTGVFNRRFFDDYLQREVSRASRDGRALSVAMIDVDLFKPFNDRYGHAAGDQALRRVARALQLSMSRNDLMARYGGEEFVVILRDTTAETALAQMELCRQAVARVDLLGDPSEPVRVSVSVGVAGWPSDGETALDLLAEADRRLFAAKSAGRNRVIGPASTASTRAIVA